MRSVMPKLYALWVCVYVHMSVFVPACTCGYLTAVMYTANAEIY